MSNSDYGHLSNHIILNKNRLVIIVENLNSDFEIACNEVISMIQTNKLKHEKVKEDFLATNENITP